MENCSTEIIIKHRGEYYVLIFLLFILNSIYTYI